MVRFLSLRKKLQSSILIIQVSSFVLKFISYKYKCKTNIRFLIIVLKKKYRKYSGKENFVLS